MDSFCGEEKYAEIVFEKLKKEGNMSAQNVSAFDVVKFFVIATNGHGKMLSYREVSSDKFSSREEFYAAVLSVQDELKQKYPGCKTYSGAGDSIARFMAGYGSEII